MSQSIDCVLKGEHEHICFMLNVFVLLCECVPLPSPVHTALVCKQRGVNRGQDCTKPQCFIHLFTSLSLSFLSASQPLQARSADCHTLRPEEAIALHASLLDESGLALLLVSVLSEQSEEPDAFFYPLVFCFFSKM